MWVKLPSNCWGIDDLGKIGSLVGQPVCADEATSQKSRVNYARMLIVFYLTRPLFEEVQVQRVSGSKFKQKVQFKWRPLVCFKCVQLRHCCSEEQPKLIKKWVPKVSVMPQVE